MRRGGRNGGSGVGLTDGHNGAAPSPSRLARNSSASVAAALGLFLLFALQFRLAFGLACAKAARNLLQASSAILLLPPHYREKGPAPARCGEQPE